MSREIDQRDCQDGFADSQQEVIDQLRARNAELERQLAEAQNHAEEYRTLIASTPNGALVADAMVARMQVLREGKEEVVSLRAYKALQDSFFKLEERLDQAEQRIAESQRQEPVGYVRVYGIECLQGILLNKTTGRTPLPSRTIIDPYPLAEDDRPLYSAPIVQPDVEEAVKAEREACAKICDDMVDEVEASPEMREELKQSQMAAMIIADAIRARSGK